MNLGTNLGASNIGTNIDKPKQIILLLFILSIIGLAGIYFAVENIKPLETKVESIEESMIGRLVKISGAISNIRKSKSGNLYWTVSDDFGDGFGDGVDEEFGDGVGQGRNITVPILNGEMKKAAAGAKRGDVVEIVGLVSEYNGELELMPKEILILNEMNDFDATENT